MRPPDTVLRQWLSAVALAAKIDVVELHQPTRLRDASRLRYDTPSSLSDLQLRRSRQEARCESMATSSTRAFRRHSSADEVRHAVPPPLSLMF